MPRARASCAMLAATSRTRAVSNVAASPIAAGNTVAPRRMTPCTPSSNASIGIPRRVESAKYRWSAL